MPDPAANATSLFFPTFGSARWDNSRSQTHLIEPHRTATSPRFPPTQKTSRYFRKVVGKKARSITNARVRGARAVAHDFLAYLADKQVFDEALDVSQVGN